MASGPSNQGDSTGCSLSHTLAQSVHIDSAGRTEAHHFKIWDNFATICFRFRLSSSFSLRLSSTCSIAVLELLGIPDPPIPSPPRPAAKSGTSPIPSEDKARAAAASLECRVRPASVISAPAVRRLGDDDLELEATAVVGFVVATGSDA